jgi:uncharacterized protein
MALMARWRTFGLGRQRAEEAQLAQRVTALQSALAQCRSTARHWWDVRTGIMAALMLALGFTLGVYSGPLTHSAVKMARAVGIASPVENADPAYAAYHNADYADALKLVRPLAAAGDARAESLLGLLYYRGRGVQQSDNEAVSWFRRAAGQGDGAARFYLGLMYGEGRGVPQDFGEAAKWYRLAADVGDAQAQYNLGLAYARGEGVTQDVVSAHVWFNLAAANFPASDSRNRNIAVKNRDTVAGEMTADQITEAQKRAREWKPL